MRLSEKLGRQGVSSIASRTDQLKSHKQANAQLIGDSKLVVAWGKAVVFILAAG